MFKDFLGNNKIKETLTRTWLNAKLPSAYIFHGPEGIGKFHLALEFTKLLNCLKPENNEPCGRCYSCIQIRDNIFPDFHLIDSDKKIITIDLIRELFPKLYVRSFSCKKRVVMINDAEKMNLNSQNCLLKTLEEPPTETLMILVTSMINKILPTVRSRCIKLNFSKPDPELLIPFVEKKYTIEKAKAEILVNLSNSSFSRIEEMANGDYLAFRLNILHSIVGIKDPFALAQDFEKEKERIKDVLLLMKSWFFDLLLLKKNRNKAYLINKDLTELLESHSQNFSIEKILRILDKILMTEIDLNYNVNFRLLMETLLLLLI